MNLPQIQQQAIHIAVKRAADHAHEPQDAAGRARVLVRAIARHSAQEGTHMTEALRMLARFTPLPDGGTHESEDEARRLEALAVYRRALLDAGARPMECLDGILETCHVEWGQGLLWEMGSQADTGLGEDGEGQNVLHVLARGSCAMVRAHTQASPWFPFPKAWGRMKRKSDGATPLHVVWMPEGLAGTTRKWASGKQASWMAYEVLEDAIRYSAYLLERQGASWDDEDNSGVRAGERLLMAWEDGVDAWLPNVVGVGWIAEVVDRERRRRQAQQASKTLATIASGARSTSAPCLGQGIPAPPRTTL